MSAKLITTLRDLAVRAERERTAGRRVVACQGHFNVIHPGHLRFLEFARKQGDWLVVLVQGETVIEARMRDKFYSEEERARGVASIEFVDAAYVFGQGELEEAIKTLRPSVYVKGAEHAQRAADSQVELDAVRAHGGRVVFSAGDLHYFSAEFLDKELDDIQERRWLAFRAALRRQQIEPARLLELCDAFARCRVMVIGDTIVDQYVACDALGMSSEAPVLVVRELDSKEYVGGGAVVSKHVRALGADCDFISLIGTDSASALVRRELESIGVRHHLAEDPERPTTFKIRYLVGTQKVLRVSRLREHPIDRSLEEELISHLETRATELDGLVVSDFGYGLLTPSFLEHIRSLSQRHEIRLFGDTQSSSQIGNVLKFKDYFLLTPNEREARISLDQKHVGLEVLGHQLLQVTGAANVMLTLAGEGCIAFVSTDQGYNQTQHFPALNPNPVDVVGAGDCMLASLAVSCCAGATVMEAAALASLLAALAVGKIGNVAVGIDELREALSAV